MQYYIDWEFAPHIVVQYESLITPLIAKEAKQSYLDDDK